MNYKINHHTSIRIVLILMAVVALLYGAYNLNKPDSLYKALILSRYLLFAAILLGFYVNKIRFDINTIVPVLFACYEFCRAFISGGNILNQGMTILTWPCIYVLFYSYTTSVMRNGHMHIKKVQNILLWTMWLMALCSIPLIKEHLSGNGRAGEVIFAVYFFLTMLSVILLLFPYKKIIWLIPCVMIILTTKRAGLLVLVTGLLLAELSEYYLEGNVRAKIRRLGRIIAIIFVGVLVFVAIVRIFELDILDRMLSLSDDGGSGRTKIWAAIFENYSDGSVWQQIFGRGYQAVTELMLTGRAILAHNDYIEILYDYGIVGLVLCVTWIVQILLAYLKAGKYKLKILPSFSYTICSLLILSMSSYLIIQSYMMMYTACYLGIAVAIVKNKRLKVQQNIST